MSDEFDRKDHPMDRAKERVAGTVDKARERFQSAAGQLGEKVKEASDGAQRASARLREGAGRSQEAARERYDATVHQLRDGYSRVRGDLDGVSEDVGDFVRDNPGKAVLIAAGAGFLLGLLFHRRDEA